MRDSRLPYVAVGAFVVVVLAGLVVAIALLEGRTGATDTYYAYFEQVGGVSYGTQVLYQGYPIGQVQGVTPVPGEGRFRVEMALKEDWFIDDEAAVRITQGGSFLSAMVLDIRGGGGDARIPPGDPDRPIPSVAPVDVFSAIQGVAEELTSLMQDAVRPLVESAADEVPATLANLRAFSEQLDALGGRLEALLDEESVERVRNAVRNVEAVSADAAELTAGLGETRRRVDAAVQTLERLAAENEDDVRQAVRDLQFSLESVALHIEALMDNLETTSRNLGEFSRQVRQDPSLLLRGTAPEDGEGPGAAR